VKQAHLERSLEPSYPRPNYDTFIKCDQEFGCEEDHDHIMMLNDQPTTHISNTTILEPNKQAQPQDYGLSQIFHEVDYAKE